MASLPYDTPQRLLAEAYRELAPTYVADAFRFLLADPRRLVLGEGGAYDTQKLIESISPLLPNDQLGDLEDFVLSHSGRVERRYGTTYDLERRGQDQLFLLQAFPRDRLSERSRRTLGELERKFPGFVPVYPPRATMASFVGSPIGAPAAEKMSDAAWLGAMAKYAHGVGHKHDGLGGARQLAAVLQRRVQEEPERFYALVERTPRDLDNSYVEALLEGLVESTAPRECVFNLVRRFAPREDRNLRRQIAWVLDKVVAAGGLLPTDLIELLGEWVGQPKGEDETHWEGESQDLLTGAINTERGAAFQTLLDALTLESGSDALQARWAWMEYAADEPSVLLRAVALMSLLHLIDKDRDRSITLFERMAGGAPRLRESHPFQEFLYWGTFRQFSRLAPYIEQVMRSKAPATRRRGAELAVVWSISHRGLESDAARETAERLAEEAVSGPAEWRRGAAHIYAYNLVEGPTDLCVAGLRRLLNDDDEEVRREADGFVRRLREEHVVSLQGFLSDFAASRTYREFPHIFAKYLWENGLLDPTWALGIVRATLDNPYPSGRHGGMGGGEELVRLVLRLYTDPTADTLRREQAMDTFDRLMELHSGYAWMVLEEWDRG